MQIHIYCRVILWEIYNTDGFEQALRENTDIFIDRMNIPVKSDSFGIEPIKAKKVVIPVFGRNTDASLGIFKLNDDIKDNTMTGVMSGIFTNDKEIKDTINAVTVAEVFTHLKKEVDEYYGESN